MSAVTPAEVYDYLVNVKGVPEAHALGMLANIKAESGFRPDINEVNPVVPGSRGGFGLFQHTGPRREALEAYAGDRLTDWRTQIDFALSEPDSKRYLAQQFADPADATDWFLRHWERPAVANTEQRLKYLQEIQSQLVDPRMAGGTGGYPVSPHSLPDKGAPPPYGGFAQEYPGSMRTPPINPSGPAYEQYLRDVGLSGGMPGGQGGLLGMDPMQYLRPNKPTLAEGLLAFGDLFQPPDRRIGGLEMAKRRIMSGGGMPQVEQLQAANELMQLQERSRANRLRMQQEQRNQQFQQRQADRLDALAAQIETVDPYQAEAYRNQAAAMRAGAVKEVYGLEPYVPPEPPGPPETTNINGVPHVYDQAQGTFVPATVMDPQTGQPTYARPEPSGPPKTTEINGVPHEYNPSTGTYSPVRVTTPEGDVDYAQPPASGPDIDFGNSVADDWRQESAPLTVPLRRYKDVKDYDPADLSPAQMRALIVNYAKFLDPTSAVMENEADAVANAGQAFPALRDLWRRAIDGKLPEDTARSIIDEMGSLAEKRQDELIEKHKVFSDRLRLGGITDPTPWLGSPVIVDFKEKESKNEEEDETYVPDPTVDLSEWDFGE
jgi:hypothetical protein